VLRVASGHLDCLWADFHGFARGPLGAAVAAGAYGEGYLVAGAAGVGGAAEQGTRHGEQGGIIADSAVLGAA
jgi:hypothetical protein